MGKVGRPSKKNQYLGEVMRMYVEQKCSLGEIQDALGPSVQTLSRWLREEGIELEHRSRNPNAGRTPEQQAEINARISASVKAAKLINPGGRPVGPRDVRTCRCGNAFSVVPSSTQQSCSRSCAKSHQAELLTERLRAEWGADPRSLCACGDNRIPYEHRHTWRYCSDECRAEYGLKRQPDPEKWHAFTCLNPVCAREVTRRKGQGYGKYCSNECARRHTKTKKHIVVDDAIVLDSSWEALFWGLCGLRKLPIERYDRNQGVEWKEGAWYAPDFWLPTLELAVEVKGQPDEDDTTKWAAFDKVHRLVVLERDDLESLCKTDDITGTLAGFRW